MWKFERRAGEKTVIITKEGEEFSFTIDELTATRAVITLEPSESVKRVLKEEPNKS